MTEALRQRLKPYLSSLMILLVIIYAVAQCLTGDRGLFSQGSRSHKLAERSAELARLESLHHELLARERYLRSDHLSRDLLEERARLILGFSGPNEYIVRQPGRPDQHS